MRLIDSHDYMGRPGVQNLPQYLIAVCYGVCRVPKIHIARKREKRREDEITKVQVKFGIASKRRPYMMKVNKKMTTTPFQDTYHLTHTE